VTQVELEQAVEVGRVSLLEQGGADGLGVAADASQVEQG
jgi:hypothetical protein